jgi:hypothetical protein
VGPNWGTWEAWETMGTKVYCGITAIRLMICVDVGEERITGDF